MKLLILADDFTGALDTGVQFAAKGVATSVIVDPAFSMEHADPMTQVLVLDAETRHLTGEEAYHIVYRAVKDALGAGFTHIYKKTDSALRGNVGSELTAVIDAAGADRLAFVPALPRMNRVTRNGVLFIDGVPVAESIFGDDPFEPVTCSAVEEIIHAGSRTPVVVHSISDEEESDHPGIHVYDAETDEDLYRWGRKLGEAGVILSAGCAGFASVVAELLPEAEKPELPTLKNGLFVSCGSVNAVTLRQMERAEEEGFVRIHLTPEQKLDAHWPDSCEAKEKIREWLTLSEGGRCILDVNDPKGSEDTAKYSEERGLSVEYRRRQISANLARLVKEMLDGGLELTLLCTGGDTLLALMKEVGVNRLDPVGELAPGAVLTRFEYRGKTYDIISKSGGFGEPDLFIKLADSAFAAV